MKKSNEHNVFKNVKLLVLDVDGVLTDGQIIISDNGVFQSSPGYPLPNSLLLDSKSGSALVPPALIALGLYAGSMWKSVHDIDKSNRKLVQRYAGRVTAKLPIERFMDYETPDFIIK